MSGVDVAARARAVVHDERLPRLLGEPWRTEISEDASRTPRRLLRTANFDLTGQFRPPYFHAYPWGDPPVDGLEAAYRWEFSTDYSEVAVGDTAYSEVGPSA